MPGIFYKSNRPKRPGAYTNFVSATKTAQPAPLSGTVAMLTTSDWGPDSTPVAVSSLADYVAKFGDTATTQGYFGVRQAFQGEGLAGRGGAASVIVYRMVGSAGATATKTLSNTSSAAALPLVAKYKGSRGNNLKVSVVANAADSTNYNDLVVYENTTELERYTHAKTDITSLAASINASSNWITATTASVVTGTALALVSSQAFTSGNDGSTLVNGDYTTAFSAFETQRFGVFVPATAVTDNTIFTSLNTWVTTQNTTGRRFVAVVGGALNETITTATSNTTGAALFNNENVIRVGVGSVVDSVLGTLSTAQLAPRVAGIIAARGETASVTFARLAGVTIASGPADADILTALSSGVLVVARDSNADAPVRLEKGITTYTSDTAAKPKSIYGNIKFVRTIHGLEMDITSFAEANVIGRLPVNNASREYLVGQAYQIMKARETSGAIQSGWTVGIDQDPPPSDSDEFIGLVYSLKFGRGIEQLFNTIYVG